MQGTDELSIEEMASNLSTYKEQLQQVKQLLRDDPGNLEYVDMEKELAEVIALTEELLATAKQNEISGSDIGTSISVPSAQSKETAKTSDHGDEFPVGTKVQAVWSEDGEWYDATIEAITPNGYYVAYDGWGNKEEVDPANVRAIEYNALLEAEKVAEATKQAIKRKIAQAASVDFQSRSLPAKLRIASDDPEDVKAAKRKKIHAFKSKMRFEQLEVAQNKRQNAWQQFQTTKGKTKKVGGCFWITMASEVERKAVFNTESAKEVVKELRASLLAGKTKSYEWRRTQLKALLKMMEENEPQIVAALREDLSKPELESSIYEIAMLKNSCKLALKEIKHWMKPEKAKTSLITFPSSAEIVSEPLGVVLIISAWNYPFLLSLDPVVGAIAAGNAVLLKPSEIAPATASLLAKLLANYLDSSCIKVVEGAVPETTALLEQKWDKIMYTGNGRIARIVMAAAAKHLTPVVLELGGKSPVIVDSDINLQVATRRIIAGKWGCNNGQACISPDYIITTKDYALKLVDSFKCELERFYGKNSLESKDLSRIVNSNHFARLSKLLDEDKVSSKIVHGGERDKTNLRIAPTILLDVPQDSLIMNEEIFGPLLPIITVNKVEDSFDLVNSSGAKPLAAYLFTNDKKLKEKFVETVSAGGLVINDTAVHLAEHTLPFGGVGDSGMGSYHGKFSFDAFSHKKSVLYRSFAGDASVRYAPYTTGKLRLLQALLGGSILGIIRALLGWSKA